MRGNINKLKLFYLIFTGELIFALPFHVNRFFRPSLLEDFQYTNYMMGIAFTTYGITALICYFPAGYIAEKFNARKLLSISLILTSLGGILLLFYNNFFFLCFIYGYWGITSILFCWSALIKATKIVGGNRQGLSFGILEAGRGLVAATLSSIAVIVFTSTFIKNINDTGFFVAASPLKAVIAFYSITTFISGIVIWFCFKDESNSKSSIGLRVAFKKIKKFYKLIFFQSLIVFTAYSVYKGIDYYSQFFYEIMNYSKEKAASTMSNLSYLRPLCAIFAGLIADKISATKLSIYLFITLIIVFLYLGFISTIFNLEILIMINIMISMAAVFALRGIYFCYLQETRIPTNIIGFSVGIISLIGFFPDVYIGPVFGYFLDTYNKVEAFNLCYLFLFILSLIGLLSAFKLHNSKKKM
jgi:MFS family permease